MTLTDLNSYISFRTGVDTNVFATADRVISLNRWLQKIWSMILASMDDWQVDDPNQTSYPIVTTPLIANQRDYTLPSSLKVLKIRRVDISYDGTNYYRINPFDDSVIGSGLGNDTKTDANFTQSSPFYDVQANGIFIYPRATSSTGTLRVEFEREPIEIAAADLSSTNLPPLDQPFHVMLALGVVYDWASTRHLADLKTDVMQELADYENRLKVHYTQKNDDEVWILRNPYISSGSGLSFPPNPPTQF